MALYWLLTPHPLFAQEHAAIAADGPLRAAIVLSLEEDLRQGVAYMAGPPARRWTLSWALAFVRTINVLGEPLLAGEVYARGGAGPGLWAALLSAADLLLS